MSANLIALVGGFVFVGCFVFWFVRQIKRSAKDEYTADAAEEQLEMNREADAIEKQVAELSDKALDEELSKWSRKQ